MVGRFARCVDLLLVEEEVDLPSPQNPPKYHGRDGDVYPYFGHLQCSKIREFRAGCKLLSLQLQQGESDKDNGRHWGDAEARRWRGCGEQHVQGRESGRG